ncbi:hypothetical protein ACIGXM_19400 [Kitasatospora sp. NPDC052896]
MAVVPAVATVPPVSTTAFVVVVVTTPAFRGEGVQELHDLLL